MALVKQVFDVPPSVKEITTSVQQALKPLELTSKIKPGETVAITAGSRGIANIAGIMRAVIDELKRIGAAPFVVPAMGSHGGATPDGQLDILRQLGITRQSMGVPIKASMQVVKIGKTLGFPVYLDKFASQADHIVIVARIKPHTDFKGEIESGFYKMMAIGIGKHKGAATCHKAFVRYGHSKVLLDAGRLLAKKTRIAFAIGVVENAYEQTSRIEAVLPANMEQTEKKLLLLAKLWMMKLPFDEIDILIVDELGKDISGDGMDPNVTGRFGPSFNQLLGPKIGRILVLDLTRATRGNALGIGRADFTTRRLVEKIDRNATYTNALTCLDPAEAKVPPYFDSDHEALNAALGTLETKPEAARVVRIKNTLALSQVQVSAAYLPLIKKRKDLVLISDLKEMRFDSHGNLLPLNL
jgi:hypothetical protein